MKGATFLLTLLLFFYSSCLKKDKVLPLLSSAGTMDSVVIGEQYQEVVYYDFEMKKIVATAKVDDWDLSFEKSAIFFVAWGRLGGRVLSRGTKRRKGATHYEGQLCGDHAIGGSKDI